MEEEGGDDSEMIDAMDGWDSDQDDSNAAGSQANANGNKDDQGSGSDDSKKKSDDGKKINAD